MDAFKLAFETAIVGSLAFLWVGIAIDLLSPNFLTRLRSVVAGVNQSLIGAALFAAAYCIGSAVLPISAQLVNDEHWPLPGDSVRCLVVVEEERRLSLVDATLPNQSVRKTNSRDCDCSYWTLLRARNKATDNKTFLRSTPSPTLAVNNGMTRENRSPSTHTEEQKLLTLTQFELQETRALGQGVNKEELFRQLRERIIVLRGAVFSGFVLFLICLFGCIAPKHGQTFKWLRMLPGILLASALTIFVLRNGYQDLMNPSIFDIPVLEAVLGAITIFGGFLAVNGVKRGPFVRIRFLVLIALCAAISYGGWIWSEVLYDQQVINFSAVLETGAPSSTSGSPGAFYQASETP